MPDIALIQSAITGLKTAADIAKGILDLKTMAEVQGKIIELQAAILSAQSSALAAQSDQFAMVEEIRALKEEIARVKAWEEQKQRYALYEVRSNRFVYLLKESRKGTEPPHWICAKCYEDGRKSVLQFQGTYFVDTHCLTCHLCKNTIPMHEGIPELKYFPD